VPWGRCVGSKQVRAELLEYIEEQRRKWHYDADLSESAEAKAEQLLTEAPRVGGNSQEPLANWRKAIPSRWIWLSSCTPRPFVRNSPTDQRAEPVFALAVLDEEYGMNVRLRHKFHWVTESE
jgi:hypothetical protein